jgi:hypothetical protein
MSTVAEQSTAIAPRQSNAPVRAGFFDLEGFELLQRVAKAFASSSLVPQQFQNNVANCMIALNLAERLKADALMVMQNLYIVHGRPGWSSKFLIATFNHCGRFTAVKYEFFGKQNTDSWGCRASSTELSSGETIIGPDITIQMAKDEGWYNKSGSKWKTIPQLMLMYRSAGWMINTAAPEISMGLPTQDELHDIIDVRPDGTVSFGGVEESGTRAPAADVVQPQSKSANAAALTQADADGVIQQPAQRQAEPVQQNEPPAQQVQQTRQTATRTRAQRAEQEQFEDMPATPISDSALRVLKTKMENNAISESDIKKQFGFDLDGVTSANYNAVVEFVENPMGQ